MQTCRNWLRGWWFVWWFIAWSRRWMVGQMKDPHDYMGRLENSKTRTEGSVSDETLDIIVNICGMILLQFPSWRHGCVRLTQAIRTLWTNWPARYGSCMQKKMLSEKVMECTTIRPQSDKRVYTQGSSNCVCGERQHNYQRLVTNDSRVKVSLLGIVLRYSLSTWRGLNSRIALKVGYYNNPTVGGIHHHHSTLNLALMRLSRTTVLLQHLEASVSTRVWSDMCIRRTQLETGSRTLSVHVGLYRWWWKRWRTSNFIRYLFRSQPELMSGLKRWNTSFWR
jgi:hypothetical protein